MNGQWQELGVLAKDVQVGDRLYRGGGYLPAVDAINEVTLLALTDEYGVERTYEPDQSVDVLRQVPMTTITIPTGEVEWWAALPPCSSPHSGAVQNACCDALKKVAE